MTELLIAAGVPSAVVGFGIWWIEHRLEKRQEHEEENEKNRQRFETAVIKLLDADYTLSLATARAVQRIPDAKCNGDMEAAIIKASKDMSEFNAFLRDRAVEKLN